MEKNETRYKDIINMYEDGKTYQLIADKYGISRQRVWQIVKPIYEKLDTSRRKKYDVSVFTKPTPSELYLYGKLKYLNIKFKIQPLQYYFDVLIKKYKVEIKHRSVTKNIYFKDDRYKGYCFNNLKPIHPIDYYIFICGDLKKHPDCYIYKASLIGNTHVIPINFKRAKIEKRYLKHLNNWEVFK